MVRTLYHRNAWVYIYPKHEKWTQEQFDEIFKACRSNPCVKSAQPFASMYGFRFQQTNAVRLFQKKIPAAAGYDLGGDVRIEDYKFYFKGSKKYVKCVRLLAKYGASRDQLTSLTKIFQEFGHTILGCHGIHYPLTTMNLDKAESGGLRVHKL